MCVRGACEQMAVWLVDVGMSRGEEEYVSPNSEGSPSVSRTLNHIGVNRQCMEQREDHVPTDVVLVVARLLVRL